MSWAEIQSRFAELVKARDSGTSFGEPWRAFQHSVLAGRGDPPYHLRQIHATLERTFDNVRRDDLVILDHGCGSSATLLYLLALGYEGIHGVDMGGGCEGWNRLLKEVLGIAEPRFRIYDGRQLPLANESVDLILSQEVLEHVPPHLIEAYYAEEARVLKPGGIALHQVPHRLVPYDSHTRTWFVHYLPRSLSLRVHRFLGSNMEVVENALFLRWPGYHRSKLRSYFDEATDRTLERLLELRDFDYYDGPVRLRRLVARVVQMPVVGLPIATVFRNFVMLETVAVKKAYKKA